MVGGVRVRGQDLLLERFVDEEDGVRFVITYRLLYLWYIFCEEERSIANSSTVNTFFVSNNVEGGGDSPRRELLGGGQHRPKLCGSLVCGGYTGDDGAIEKFADIIKRRWSFDSLVSPLHHF